jgi:O-acetyl-ADP-ribose deacetylase (regulator of RNase III)
MPIRIIRQDITKMTCDAIVNPSNEDLYPGGGVDAAIHEAAGHELTEATCKLGGVELGGARITKGYALPCKYIIHTAGPVWCGGDHDEERILTSCYTECLRLAVEAGCGSVAFPLISSGLYGYPKDKVMKVAISAISDFLMEHELEVYIVVFDKTAFAISEKLFSDVTAYIDDFYTEATLPIYDSLREERNYASFTRARLSRDGSASPSAREEAKPTRRPKPPKGIVASEAAAPTSLEDMLKELDKGFAATLFELIDSRGMTDVECYKRANVDKKTFSKIKCNKNYKPSKITAVSFAIALRLDMEETKRLLGTVGFTLSRSSVFDVIIEYFVTTGNYESIFDVNDTLYQFDQETLGVLSQ